MDEFPDFRFTQSQASVYEIARAVQPRPLREDQSPRPPRGAGRSQPASGWRGTRTSPPGVDRPPLPLHPPLHGDVLGLKPEDVPIDWSPRHLRPRPHDPDPRPPRGVTRYYMCRAPGREAARLLVERADGARVLVNLETTWYLKAVGPENASALLAFAAKTGLRDWMNVYGSGTTAAADAPGHSAASSRWTAGPCSPRLRLLDDTGVLRGPREERGTACPCSTAS